MRTVEVYSWFAILENERSCENAIPVMSLVYGQFKGANSDKENRPIIGKGGGDLDHGLRS